MDKILSRKFLTVKRPTFGRRALRARKEGRKSVGIQRLQVRAKRPDFGRFVDVCEDVDNRSRRNRRSFRSR